MAVADVLFRIPASVTLVAATKYASADQINTLIRAGVGHIGENRVQDALEKFPDLLPCKKHFIGTIQSNKIGKIAEHFDGVQSLCDSAHAAKLDAACERLGKKMPVLVQVNVGTEGRKKGLLPDEKMLRLFLAELAPLRHLEFKGLMAVVPLSGDSTPHFKTAKKLFDALRDEFGLTELSMGTSDDFEAAIRQGATMVRVGRALFR